SLMSPPFSSHAELVAVAVASGGFELLVCDLDAVQRDHQVGLLGRLLEHLDLDRLRHVEARFVRDGGVRIGPQSLAEAFVCPGPRPALPTRLSSYPSLMSPPVSSHA